MEGTQTLGICAQGCTLKVIVYNRNYDEFLLLLIGPVWKFPVRPHSGIRIFSDSGPHNILEYFHISTVVS